MTDTELPAVPDRVDPPFVAGERAMLESWLDFHRATLLHKCSGLDAAQLRTRSVPPSSLSLLGLVRHMTDVERYWFRYVMLGENVAPVYWDETGEDGDFDAVDTADASADLAAYGAMVETCRAAAVQVDDLDSLAVQQRYGRAVSFRWILVHMVEEYARHAGHADLIRESIDGATDL